MDERRLHELEIRAQPGASAVTGTSHAQMVTDKVGDYAVLIADLRAVIEEKQRRCIQEQKHLEQYIAGIRDSFTRQIFTYRFVRGFTWAKVAQLVGGGNTPDSVRMACRRYLRSEK